MDGVQKSSCMLCGKPTGEFVGLCDPCCRLIKAKTDAFARASKRRLDELLEAERKEKKFRESIVYDDFTNQGARK